MNLNIKICYVFWNAWTKKYMHLFTERVHALSLNLMKWFNQAFVKTITESLKPSTTMKYWDFAIENPEILSNRMYSYYLKF
jgi:hypothetical protein